MSKPSYPSVPEPTQNTLIDAVRVLKQSVELLTGQTRGVSYGAPRMFIQAVRPTTTDPGDLWIDTDTNKLSYWNGNVWIALT